MLSESENLAGTPLSQQYMTKPELASRLRRTTRTVELWMKKGMLPYLKIGRSVLFRWPDVERQLHQRYEVINQPQRLDGRRGKPCKEQPAPVVSL